MRIITAFRKRERKQRHRKTAHDTQCDYIGKEYHSYMIDEHGNAGYYFERVATQHDQIKILADGTRSSPPKPFTSIYLRLSFPAPDTFPFGRSKRLSYRIKYSTTIRRSPIPRFYRSSYPKSMISAPSVESTTSHRRIFDNNK